MSARSQFPFDSDGVPGMPEEGGSKKSALSLYELNALIHDTLKLTLPSTYWITAEISEIRVAGNGHCYLELVEKEKRGNGMRAKASAHIWRSNLALIRIAFERATGQMLAPGLKVLVEAEVEFHPLYGYSLNIVDIDATYTLGDMAQRRQEILNQLSDDGILNMNKELQLPRLLQRIAVISSASAAGYGDFCNQLEQSPFRFSTKLFPAVMQGEQVEKSIIAALDKIAAAPDYDAVAIIRGGGAVSDLSGFESYMLAANVAQFPLPVLTGIGHERDDTVVDFVAHTRLKTPTAVAAFLISRAQDELDHLQRLDADLEDTLAAILQRHRETLKHCMLRLSAHVDKFGHLGRQRLTLISSRLTLCAAQAVNRNQHRLENLDSRLHTAAGHYFLCHRNRLAMLEKDIAMADPARILRRGYSMTTKDGHIIRNAADLKPGDRVTTTFSEGTAESIIATTGHNDAPHKNT